MLSQSGTDDFRTLSAIYSQLGNAYFYLGDYVKAMQVCTALNCVPLQNFLSQYHKHDLTLARTMGDRLGEAKASGNLGNTLKVGICWTLYHYNGLSLLLYYPFD